MASSQTLTKESRDGLLQQYRETHEAIDRTWLRRTRKRERLWSKAEGLVAEYFRRLPRVIMSCCPFCGQPLRRSFDPFGLDGRWWFSVTDAEEPPPCPHFRLLRGALNFNGRRPRNGEIVVKPGPEVPYVMPRLLELPGMKAVIGELSMETGYIAYPIAYFSNQPTAARDLAPTWLEEEMRVDDHIKYDDDPWDFELTPWLGDGRLRWCLPGSNNSELAPYPPVQMRESTPCPYIDLPGRQERLCVLHNKISLLDTPEAPDPNIPFMWR